MLACQRYRSLDFSPLSSLRMKAVPDVRTATQLSPPKKAPKSFLEDVPHAECLRSQAVVVAFGIGIRGKVRLVPTHAMTFDDPEPKDQAAVPGFLVGRRCGWCVGSRFLIRE